MMQDWQKEQLKVATGVTDGSKTLAQPEQKMTYQQAAQLINEMKSQPEQEPVAWAQFSEAGNLIDLLEEPCGGYVPLYTTPPQRKPLTGDALLSAAQSCLSPSQYDHFEALIENDQDAHNRLARAIENERGK